MDGWTFGVGAKGTLEDEIERAGARGMEFVEFNADLDDNAFDRFDDARVRRVREAADHAGVRIAIHTSSAVNTAEFAPFFDAAVGRYLETNIELAARLGCEWVVVHGGFHFSAQEQRRWDTAVVHLQRACELAERHGVRLLLENHNREPEHAEMHYIPFTAAGQAWFMERLASSALGWSLNVGHANLVPEGVDGFLDLVDLERLGQLRLCDNHGEHELHLAPGQGTVDFDRLFARLRASGWSGPSVLAFDPPEEQMRAREKFRAALAA